MIDPGADEGDLFGGELGLVGRGHVLVVRRRESDAREEEAGVAIFGDDGGAGVAAGEEGRVTRNAETSRWFFAEVAGGALRLEDGADRI